MSAPPPPNEPQRLKALLGYAILDTPPEQAFDEITALAAEICEAPIALITLVDESRQWFKSRIGLPATETPRSSAFCAHALQGTEPLVVPDATKDDRFAHSTLVQGEAHVRSYAGAPLITPAGENLGTLCVMDRVPRELTDRQLRALRVLSQQVMTQLELRRHARELGESEARLFKVFRNCPVAVAIHRWDDRTFVDVNEAFTQLLGWTLPEVLGRTTGDLNLVDTPTSSQLRSEIGARRAARNTEVTIRGRNGETHRALLSSELVDLRGEPHAITTFVDITGRKRAEEALATKSEILSAVTESLAAYVERGHWGEAIGRLLRCALGQTESEYGFIGVLVDASRLRVLAHEGIVWDKVINREFYEAAMRSYAEVGYLDFTNLDNLFGRALTTGEVVIANFPDTDPRSGGRPHGHPPMRSFLGVPIFAGAKIQGVVALANRPGGYSEEDRRRIETLVQHAGGLCTSYRQHLATLAVEQEQRLAEQALRESEERFRLLARATTDAVWDWSFATNEVWWNDGYHALFGYGADQGAPSRQEWAQSIHPEDLSRVETHLKETIAQGTKLWTDHYRFKRKDGTYREILDCGSIVVDAQGRPIRMIGAMQDITDRRLAEMKLQRLAAIVESSDDAIIGKNLDSIITSWNRGAENIFGYKAAEMVGTSIMRLIPPDRQAEETLIIDKISRGESMEHFETRRRTKDGRLIEISLTASPILDAKGKVVGVSKVARDITEQKRVEARFRRLVDSNAQGVMFWNTQREITEANDALLTMLGYTREEMRAQPLTLAAILPPESAECDLQALAEIKATGIYGPVEKEYLRKDGSRVPVLVGATNFEDNPDEGVCFVVDLTDRKKLEQQFLRAQRMESIGTLAGGIAHDLNNLLVPITMGLGLIKEYDPHPESLPVIETMERSAKRGADLVKQVLSFARGVEGSRMPLQIGHIIREVESIATNTFPRNITIETRIASQLWLTQADATQVNQVLLNLFVNARDAMPDGGRLKVTAANVQIDGQYAVMNQGMVPGQYIAVQLSDTGHGIPKEIIDRIFEPFFTTKEMGKGSGLGLSTVLGIMRSHGGFVNVYSEPGQGSTFKLYFPALPDGVAIELGGPDDDVLQRGKGELVLIVDDEASILEITKQTLLAFGYKVLTAEDGAEAIGIYAMKREQIALVLTDMMMPVMDGPALIAALRRINPQVRIVAASGLNANGKVSHVTNLGVKHFLAKPYSADALLRALRTAITEPKPKGSRPPIG